jgi:hypothetical protein
MPQIVIVRSFRHCVRGAIHPTSFESSEEVRDVDEDTATIAIREGWAVPFEPAVEPSALPPAGPPYLDSGPRVRSLSSVQDRASRQNRSRRSGVARGSSR